VNRHFSVDNSKSKKLLGLKYDRDIKYSFVDMVNSAVKYGIIEDRIHSK
jgi:hypothetical protein